MTHISPSAPEQAGLLDRIAAVTSGIGRELAVIAIILMMALVALNTLARALPSVNGLYFVEEYTGYLFVAVTFMGLADTFRHHGHVRVEFLIRQLPPKPAAVLELLVTLAAIGIISVLAWFGAQLLLGSIRSGELAQTVTQTPLWIPRLCLLPGYLLLLLELLVKLQHGLCMLSGCPVARQLTPREEH
ncbi:TRAP transporter small permease [Zobellella aerophila]|uniref:TRAP transporter small permease protein n=1 Tax=Zobellella aerophila TaxID=870480 RepID=A0ABP6VE41_9GAMM